MHQIYDRLQTAYLPRVAGHLSEYDPLPALRLCENKLREDVQYQQARGLVLSYRFRYLLALLIQDEGSILFFQAFPAGLFRLFPGLGRQPEIQGIQAARMRG